MTNIETPEERKEDVTEVFGSDIEKPDRNRQMRLTVLRSPTMAPGSEDIIDRFPYLIGREGCNLNFHDRRISRQHLHISLKGGRFYLTDMKSRNGTFLNNQQLQPEQATPFNGGQVRLGTLIEFELEPLE